MRTYASRFREMIEPVIQEEGGPGTNQPATGASSTIGATMPVVPEVLQAPLSQNDSDFEKWIEHFYKECGREATLANTMRIQMTNWAMVIVAAFISAAVTLGRPSADAKSTVSLGMYAAAVGAYVFNLRFFVRAILYHINLARWNKLQASIVAAYLVPPHPKNERAASPAPQAVRLQLQTQIQDYYHNWRSPIDRKTQIVQNLKLGFVLVLALPTFFVIVWSVELWDYWLVRGLAFFAFGSTVVELTDFCRSSYFDTPTRNSLRKSKIQIFPVPVSQGGYLLTWLLNLLISSVIALWPTLKPYLSFLVR